MARLDRRTFLKTLLASAALPGGLAAAASRAGPATHAMPTPNATPAPRRMPVLFVGHGSPMNIVEDNPWSRGFRALGGLVPRPRAILAVSAHWYVDGTRATAEERPETIHDFGGFPEELYRVRYPAPGDPALARRAVALVGEGRASLATDWGLDHGTWSVLVHMRPAADVPVVQLSIDARLPPEGHLAIGRALAPLRDEGVLLLASGNVTHNLRHAFQSMAAGVTATPDWARRFDEAAAAALERHDTAWLSGALATEDGRRSHPTPDHWLPFLYAAGAASPGEPVRYPVTGFDLSSLSMRAAIIG